VDDGPGAGESVDGHEKPIHEPHPKPHRAFVKYKMTVTTTRKKKHNPMMRAADAIYYNL
jgi:hypothetical protein